MCRSLAQFPSLLGQRLPQPFWAGESQKSPVRAEAGSIRALVRINSPINSVRLGDGMRKSPKGLQGWSSSKHHGALHRSM